MTTKFEVLAANAESGLGFDLDGKDASLELGNSIRTPEQAAHDFLNDSSRVYRDGPFKGYVSVLSANDSDDRFKTAGIYAHGRTVLVPYIQNNQPMILPASIKQEASGLRVTVYNQVLQLTHDRSISEDQVIKLAGATQATSSEIGSHSKPTIAAEAGHTITMLGAALDDRVGGGSNVHSFVHQTVDKGDNIASAVSRAENNGTKLFGASITSSVFTKESFPKGMELLWDPAINQSPTMDTPLALPFIQGLGYSALVDTGRRDQTQRIRQDMQS